MKLSVILPTIRLDRLPKFVESFENSYHGEYELICVSPYDRPSGIGLVTKNLQWIIDKGNPVRCQQHGLCQASGEYIHRAVDDSEYVPNAMDRIMNDLSEDRIINIKFSETNSSVDKTHKDFQNMENAKFYKLGYHLQALKPYVPADTDLINFAIYPAKILKEMNWECEFETIALAETDLSIRIKFAEIKVELTDTIVINCDWMPGEMGDHAPIHQAFPDDLEKYKLCYSDVKCWDRIRLGLNNWEHTPEIWVRRFKYGI